MPKKKTKWEVLDGVLKEVWKMLTRGATHFNDPFHWPVLGTTGSNGSSLRTVILRDFVAADRILVCHTDARAEKIREIKKSPSVSWLFYHPKRKVQLRISGQATLHTDDQFAEAQWAATKLTSRLNYCATEAPGTTIEKPSSGLPDFLLKKIPTLLETQHGRNHFMAIACRIESMDWLRLSTMGNQRARFEWNEDGLHATWLVP
jgi:3-hydroxyisobutyrate dehydrogenase